LSVVGPFLATTVDRKKWLPGSFMPIFRGKTLFLRALSQKHFRLKISQAKYKGFGKRA